MEVNYVIQRNYNGNWVTESNIQHGEAFDTLYNSYAEVLSEEIKLRLQFHKHAFRIMCRVTTEFEVN